MADDFGSLQEDEDDSTSDENFELSDDEEDDSGSEDAQENYDKDEEVPGNSLVVNEYHVPRIPWFVTEAYTPTPMDNRGDLYLDNDSDHVELKVGSLFADKSSLKAAINKVHLTTDRDYDVLRSNKTQFLIKCKKDGCNWRLRAAKKYHGYFEITVNQDEHSCMVHQPSQDHMKLSSRMISKIVKPLVSKFIYLCYNMLFQ